MTERQRRISSIGLLESSHPTKHYNYVLHRRSFLPELAIPINNVEDITTIGQPLCTLRCSIYLFPA